MILTRVFHDLDFRRPLQAVSVGIDDGVERTSRVMTLRSSSGFFPGKLFL